MEKSSWVIFGFVIGLLGIVLIVSMLYFVVGMSSTYPPIKKYELMVSKTVFDQKLADRIHNIEGWSFKKRDSIKEKSGENCYWASLSCQIKETNIEYRIKYCINSTAFHDGDECLRLYVVGAYDYGAKSGGYKSSDKDVGRLIQNLDRTILNGLFSNCSD